MAEPTSLDYGLNLENPTSWISTSTLPEVQDTTKKDITTAIKDTPKNKENLEIPQELKDFREQWEQKIKLDDDTKKRIINAINKIPYRATIEGDGSRLVEFELLGKTYQTLDVNLEKHSDSEYLTPYEYNRQTNNEVKLGGMRGDDPLTRDNKPLADYVDKEKNSRGMEIRTIEFQRDLINKLGNSAGLTKMSDKIAMWMYLTGNYGCYWGTMGDDEKSNPKASSRSLLFCLDYFRSFDFYFKDGLSASLCLIACQ